MKTYYINNTKIANELRKGVAVPNQARKVNVGRQDQPIYCHYGIRLPGSDTRPFDWPYAMAVADSVYSLERLGASSFTISQLLHALSGDDAQKATPQKKKSLEDILDALIGTELVLDCVEEMIARGLATIERRGEWQIKSAFLPLRKEKEHYVCLDIPPLYRYAEANHQMVSFPDFLLHVSTGSSKGADRTVSNTRDFILLKRYIIQRLEIMRNQKNYLSERKFIYLRKSHLNWSDAGVYADLGIRRESYPTDDAWMHKRASLHKNILNILRYFANENLHYIDGYQEIRDQGAIINGVEILGKIHNPRELNPI